MMEEDIEDRDLPEQTSPQEPDSTEHAPPEETGCAGCPAPEGEAVRKRLVGLSGDGDGSLCYFDAGEIDLRVGDECVVETEKGYSIARVVIGPVIITGCCRRRVHGRIIRKILPEDVERQKRLEDRKHRAMETCCAKIAARGLVMKLVNVEFVEQANKVVFYFTAEGRVDFRELVKDLAAHFRKRIEMRQIGVRDEARMVGGLGSCGRQLCCTAFLKALEPISIRMAKDQELALNPTRISGLCGRLLCCLAYEHEHYKELRKHVPATGKLVKTPSGIAKVVKVNLLLERVTVQFDNDQQVEYSADEVEPAQG